MAGNFWKSSHSEQWILEKGDLLRERGEDLKIYTEEEYQKLLIFFIDLIQTMGQCVEREIAQSQISESKDRPILRMQAIGTACVYFRRFYARRSLRDIDPFLLAVTAINLASKVEEMGHLSQNKLSAIFTITLKKKWPEIEAFVFPPVTAAQIKSSEAEFCLVEMLDCSLIVYHPYRSLFQLKNDMKNSSIQNVDNLYQEAWKVCNDSLRSDASLLYPPHLIAIAAILIAAVLTGRDREKELRNWMTDLNVDFERVFEIQQLLFSTYRLMKSFDQKSQLRGLLERMPRAIGTSSIVGPIPQSIHLQ